MNKKLRRKTQTRRSEANSGADFGPVLLGVLRDLGGLAVIVTRMK